MDADILQPVKDADIPKLIEMYRSRLPRNTYVYNYLHSVLRWRQEHPESKFIQLLAPSGDFLNGTFVGVHEYACYELFIFTLENNCKILCDALLKTQTINWNRSLLMYAVQEDHYPPVVKTLENTTYRFYDRVICEVWWIPKERALQFEIECPPEVYIEKLEPSHAVEIDSVWPHRFQNSDKYIANLIMMRGGYGVFLKSSGQLVAWALRNFIGLGFLQTADGHKKKGYGSLVTKVISKEIAEDGFDPLGTVVEGNQVSRAMFRKAGFEVSEKVIFVENEELRIQ